MTHIENVNKNANSLILIGIINDKIVSIAHIGCSNSKRIMHNSEIAISVKKDYWGQGVGTMVITELINFATNHAFIKNISLRVKATNINAIKLYEKCGFNQIGVHKDYFYIKNKYYDSLLMDLQVKP
ncbi:MAG: GNAT family N-acetyltransferase [Clostridium sp.]